MKCLYDIVLLPRESFAQSSIANSFALSLSKSGITSLHTRIRNATYSLLLTVMARSFLKSTHRARIASFTCF